MRLLTSIFFCLIFQVATAQTLVIDTLSLGCPDSQFFDLPTGQVSLPVDIFSPAADVCPPASLNYQLSGATATSGSGWAGTQNLNAGVTEVTYTGCEQLSFANFLGEPAALPDGLGVEYVLPLEVTGFAEGETVAGVGGLVSICANLEHSFAGDLDIWLSCPDGSQLELLKFDDRNDVAGQRFGQGERDTNTPDPTDWYCWTLDADQTIGEYILDQLVQFGTTIPPGDYRPDGEPMALDTCPVNGAWALNIRDELFSDNGSVAAWTLTFGNASVKTCSYTITVEGEDCDLLLTGPIIADTICAGEAFNWLGAIYETAGIYLDTITSVFGCDSVVGLDLTVRSGTENCPIGQGELTGKIFRIDANGMPQPLPYTRLVAGSARDTAELDGTYLLTGLPLNVDHTIEPSLDVDHTHGISIIDVLILRSLILQSDILPRPTYPYQYIAADINGDCEIDVRDLVGLLRVYIGRTDHFPGTESYSFVPANYTFSALTATCAVPAANTLMLVDADFGDNDFIGIKMGDLNLSAGTPDPDGRVPFGFHDRHFRAGERVDVTLEPAEGLVAADLRWRFDARLLQPTGDNAFTRNVGTEMYQVWTDLSGTPTLSFIAQADGSLANALSLTSDSRGVDAAAHVFGLETNAAVPSELRLAAYPNPFQNEFLLSVSAVKAGAASLTVVDLAGREVLQRSFIIAAGTENIRIASDNWPAGVYQVVIVAEGERSNIRMVRF